MRDLRASLAARKQQGLRRRLRTLATPQGPEVVVDGRRLLAFCSNDYLGFAGDPRLARALCEGAERFGTGSGAAHLVSGHGLAHQALEEALAEFTGRPRALLFATGYAANLAVISTLAERGEPVLHDRLNHASLLDGTVLARARVVRYAHADTEDLARRLAGEPPRLVVTDGVFSMDGDLAPLPGLARAVAANGGRLLVDDAHGLGVVGPGGHGTLAHWGMEGNTVHALVGTFGKAFGTAGAFVAGDADLIEGVIHFGRPWIYSTAPSPALAHATLRALELIRSEEGEARRARLQALVARFRAGARQLGLPLGDSPTPIQPLLLGSADRALAVSEALLEAGFWVPAIRPPTVPEGTARLRITLSAAHEEFHVDRLLETLAHVLQAHPPESAA